MTEAGQDVVEMIVERLTTHFDSRLNELGRRMASLEQIIDNHADNIKHDTQFTRSLAGQVFKDLIDEMRRKSKPDADAPCPPSISRATSANPNDGNQRVDLEEHGAVVVLRPGTSADDAWDEVKTNLRRERGAR